MRNPLPKKLVPAALAMAGVLACGDSLSPRARQAILIKPSEASVLIGGIQGFEARNVLTGAADSTVSWTLDGVPPEDSARGSIAQDGLYRAPRRFPTDPRGGGAASDVTVRATRLADSTVTALATVHLVSGITSIEIVPFQRVVDAGDTVQLRAFVEAVAHADTSVEWGSKYGTISREGLYVAPLTAGEDPIWVRSVSDPRMTAGASFVVRSTLVNFNDLAEGGGYTPDWLASRGLIITIIDWADGGRERGFLVEDISGDPGFPADWKPRMLAAQGYSPGPMGGLDCNYWLRLSFVRPVTQMSIASLASAGTIVQSFDSTGSALDSTTLPVGFSVAGLSASGIASVLVSAPSSGCHVHDNIWFVPTPAGQQ